MRRFWAALKMQDFWNRWGIKTGGAINLNIRFHSVVLDGVYCKDDTQRILFKGPSIKLLLLYVPALGEIIGNLIFYGGGLKTGLIALEFRHVARGIHDFSDPEFYLHGNVVTC